LLACCSLIYNSYYDTGDLGSPPRRATASAGRSLGRVKEGVAEHRQRHGRELPGHQAGEGDGDQDRRRGKPACCLALLLFLLDEVHRRIDFYRRGGDYL